MAGVAIEAQELTSQQHGATRPDLQQWTPPTGFRSFESTTLIGHGPAEWATAAHDVVRWAVKTPQRVQR